MDVPGGNGSLDLTEAHGEVKFKDREGCKFIFTMNPSDDLSNEGYEEKKKEVSNALNGKYFEKITLDKDDGYYYSGRCKVDQYLSNKRIRQFVITARLKPYKLKQSETVMKYKLLSTEKTVTMMNGRKSIIPKIICTDDNTKIIFGEIEKTLSAGTHQILDIQFKEGANVLKLSGSGTITFVYREGEL
ncbi:MAG: hypothetical protein IKY14_00840 [Erysipelotrichaceae bacterium]|nr:hypothetical protein [Erysipelotrichaceae bacterium]